MVENKIKKKPSFDQDPLVLRNIAEAWRFFKSCWFNPVYGLENALIDLLPHQLIAVYDHLLPQNRLRFLLADDAGAGKTIMTGLYLIEMLQKKKFKRVLIICPAGLVFNWYEELIKLFQLPFSIITGEICRKKEKILDDFAILSIDTAWRVEEIIKNSTPWDIVIFDEAHKLSVDLDKYGMPSPTNRYRIAEVFSRMCIHLLLLTATPHQGKDYPYFGLWKLLEPSIFLNPEALKKYFQERPKERNNYILRRLKEDMIDNNGEPLYPTRICKSISYPFSDLEQTLYNSVTKYVSERYARAEERKRSAVNLAMTIIQRRMASSTYSLLRSLENRKEKLLIFKETLKSKKQINQRIQKKLDQLKDVLIEKTSEEEIPSSDSEENETNEKELMGSTDSNSLDELNVEIDEIDVLITLSKKVLEQKNESKWIHLKNAIQNIKDPLNIEKTDEIKILIFTEYRDTKKFLIDRLNEIGYTGRIAEIDGTMKMKERREQIKLFKSKGYRFLVATDAAGEGINLQFSWVLINYDIPWNPARLEQRMGRIHRYKQKHDPVLIFNIIAHDSREGRVLEVLLDKLNIIKKAFIESFPDDNGADKVFDIIGEQFVNIPLNEIIIRAFIDLKDERDAIKIVNETLKADNVFNSIKNSRNFEGGYQNVKNLLGRVKDIQQEGEKYKLMPEYIKLFFKNAVNFLGYSIKGETDEIFSVEPYDHFISSISKIYPDEIQNKFSFNPKKALPDSFEELKAIFLHPSEPVFEAIKDLFLSRTETIAKKGALFLEPGGQEPYLFNLISVNIYKRPPNGQFDSQENSFRDVIKSFLFAFKRDSNGVFKEIKIHHLLDLVPVFIPASSKSKINVRDRIPSELIDSLDNLDEIYSYINNNYLNNEISTLKVESKNYKNKIRESIRSAYNLEEYNLVKIKKNLREAIINDEPLSRMKFKDISKKLVNLKIQLKSDLETLSSKSNEFKIGNPENILIAAVLPTNIDEESEKIKFDCVRSEIVAMNLVEQYEKDEGAIKFERVENPWTGAGYDIISERGNETRFIEVKGRLGINSIDLTDNEWARAAIERERYFLYLVFNCKEENPELWIYQDPFGKIRFKQKTIITINVSQIKEGGIKVR